MVYLVLKFQLSINFPPIEKKNILLLDRRQKHTEGEGRSVRHRQAHPLRHHQRWTGKRNLDRKLVIFVK
jgi:hypothetical protein